MRDALKNLSKDHAEKYELCKCLHSLDVIYGFHQCQGRAFSWSWCSFLLFHAGSEQKCPVKDTTAARQSDCARKIR